LPLEQYRPMAGAGARGMLAVAFGMTPDHPEFATLREEFFQNYERRMTDATRVFQGVAELIGVLAERGLAWGVVTNKHSRFALPLTRAMPLFCTATAVVAGDTTPYSKPHPAPLLEAARLLRLAPEQCLYVGDDERDIVAGRAAGMPTVAATYGYLGGKADPAAWRADAQIDSPLELLGLLQSAASS
jgi:N-acetyl-D-muramate 6-phosphate phosphatase